MSETTRYRPWAEPGAAGVTFLPKMTEAPEPGGVIRDRDDGDLELHVDLLRLRGLDDAFAVDLSAHDWLLQVWGKR